MHGRVLSCLQRFREVFLFLFFLFFLKNMTPSEVICCARILSKGFNIHTCVFVFKYNAFKVVF